MRMSTVRFEDVSPAILAARSRELKQLGVPEASASDVDACPGAIASAARRAACPRQPMLTAVVSMPEPLGERSLVDVVILAADSATKVTLLTGYVLAFEDGRLTVVEQRTPVIVE